MDGELDLMHKRIEDERYYRAMIHLSPFPMILADRSGAYVDGNEAAAKFLEVSIDELRTLRFQQVTHRKDMIYSMEMVNSLLSGALDSYEQVKRYITKGGVKWAAVKVNAIRDPAGILEMYVVHIATLNGCGDNVMQDVLNNLHKRIGKIVITPFSLILFLLAMTIIEIIVHMIIN